MTKKILMLITAAVKKRNKKMNLWMMTRIFSVIKKICKTSMKKRMKRRVKILSWGLFPKMKSTILKMMI